MQNPTYINKEIEKCHGIAKAAYVAILNYYRNCGIPYFHLFPDFHSIVADAAIEIYKVSKTDHPLRANQRLLFLCGFNQIRNETLINPYYARRKWIPLNQRFNENSLVFIEDLKTCTKSLLPKNQIDAWQFSLGMNAENLKMDYERKLKLPINSLFRRKIFCKTEFSSFFNITEENPKTPVGHMTLFMFHERNANGRLYVSTKSIKEWGQAKGILVERQQFKSVDALLEKRIDFLEHQDNICFLNDIQMHSLKTMTYSKGLKSAFTRLETDAQCRLDKIEEMAHTGISSSAKELLDSQKNEYKNSATLHETTANIIHSRLEGLRLIKKDERLEVKKKVV